jgi:hypothetical protein
MSQPPSQGNAEESCTARKLPQFDATGQSALTSERAETVGVPARSVSPFLEQVEQPSNLSVESPQQDTQKPVCEKSFSSDVKTMSSDLPKESMSTTQLMSKRKFEERETKALALTEPETKKLRVSEKIASASVLSVTLPEVPLKWTDDDVCRWAIESVKIIEHSARILKKQEVNGIVLLTLTKEELLKILPLGPATKLAKAVEELKAKTRTLTRTLRISQVSMLPNEKLLTRFTELLDKDLLPVLDQNRLIQLFQTEFPTIPQLGNFNSEGTPLRENLPAQLDSDKNILDLTYLSGDLDQPDGVSEIVKAILDNLSVMSIHYVVGVSGCGKTKVLLDVSRQYFVLLFEFDPIYAPDVDHCFSECRKSFDGKDTKDYPNYSQTCRTEI